MMKKTIRILLLLAALMLFSVSAAADGESVLTLPENLKVVPEEAFLGNGATTLVISPGCEAIRGNAFGNSRLRTVSVPESVTQIAENAFAGCGKIIFRTSNPVAVRFAAEHRMPVLSP